MANIKITKITASFSCKKQIRQYEPIEVFMSAEAEINTDNPEQIAEAQQELFEITKSGVAKAITKILP